VLSVQSYRAGPTLEGVAKRLLPNWLADSKAAPSAPELSYPLLDPRGFFDSGLAGELASIADARAQLARL
jgi:hypothetical protein